MSSSFVTIRQDHTGCWSGESELGRHFDPHTTRGLPSSMPLLPGISTPRSQEVSWTDVQARSSYHHPLSEFSLGGSLGSPIGVFKCRFGICSHFKHSHTSVTRGHDESRRRVHAGPSTYPAAVRGRLLRRRHGLVASLGLTFVGSLSHQCVSVRRMEQSPDAKSHTVVANHAIRIASLLLVRHNVQSVFSARDANSRKHVSDRSAAMAPLYRLLLPIQGHAALHNLESGTGGGA
ncbi:hypothetical protein C8Q77DRAFT_638346 [Trametes polyzona]|nr:hypothetical protein C8Q77DRAFT_638346 [Trametes polyzona]